MDVIFEIWRQQSAAPAPPVTNTSKKKKQENHRVNNHERRSIRFDSPYPSPKIQDGIHQKSS